MTTKEPSRAPSQARLGRLALGLVAASALALASCFTPTESPACTGEGCAQTTPEDGGVDALDGGNFSLLWGGVTADAFLGTGDTLQLSEGSLSGGQRSCSGNLCATSWLEP